MKLAGTVCLVAALTGAAPSAFAACPGFLVAPTYRSGGTAPRGVAVGDFNADGRNDLAVANETTSNVSVFLGNGDGTLAMAVNYAVGLSPQSVAVGDFNGDGRTDLVSTTGSLTGANQMGGVSILLGTGNGSFTASVTYAAGLSPISVAVADFNGDGRSDLAVANNSASDVSILIGNGNGTFASAVNYAAGTTPHFVASGDFNGDNRRDLVVANFFGNGFSILLGNGNGTFGTAVFFPSGTYTSSVAIGDFNGDARSDLAVSNAESRNVSIHLGNGAGSFGTGVGYATGFYSSSVVAGDFNGDARSDLAVVNYGGGDISILIGSGTGTFATAVNYLTAGGWSIAAADFNGDGRSDLAASNYGQNDVSILIGKGNGIFDAARNFNGGQLTFPASAVASDFNGDGRRDLAMANQTVGWIVTGNGDGTFGAPVSYTAGAQPIFVNAGDFNADGRNDLVVVNAANFVSILLGNGNGSFAQPVNYTITAATDSAPVAASVGDLNGDGRSDLAVATQGQSTNFVAVLIGNGNGTFGTPVTYATGSFPQDVAIGDFNADGRRDLVTANYAADTLSVLIGNGNGSFATAVSYPVGSSSIGPTNVRVADFNGDGRSDLVANGSTDSVQILLGNGNGTFAAAVGYAANLSRLFKTPVEVGDFDGDGKVDVVANLSILLGRGDGTVAAPLNFNHGLFPATWVVPSDLNGDGKSDLAVGNSAASSVAVLLNNSVCTRGDSNGDGQVGVGDVFYLISNLFANGPAPVGLADANGDGQVSVADIFYMIAFLFTNGPAPR